MTNLTNLANLKKLSTLATIATTTLGVVSLIADKVDERNRTIRRGYEKIHVSHMACKGLEIGEFCITDSNLCIHLLPNDEKENVAICSLYIERRIELEAELDIGFYAVNVEGKLRKAFFDGEYVNVIIGGDHIKVTNKLDLETANLIEEVNALRKQLNKADDMAEEIKALRKKIEDLAAADAEKAAKIEELAAEDKSTRSNKKKYDTAVAE